MQRNKKNIFYAECLLMLSIVQMCVNTPLFDNIVYFLASCIKNIFVKNINYIAGQNHRYNLV